MRSLKRMRGARRTSGIFGYIDLDLDLDLDVGVKIEIDHEPGPDLFDPNL